jgi:hypothetical protein
MRECVRLVVIKAPLSVRLIQHDRFAFTHQTTAGAPW